MTDRADERTLPPPPEPESRSSGSVLWSDGFLGPSGRSGAGFERFGVSSTLKLALMATLMLVLWVLVWDSRQPRQEDLSPDVLGRWRAATAPFTDRTFWLSRESLAFDQGSGHLASYPIRLVAHRQGDGIHRYRVIYRAEGGDAELDLEYDPAARTLRMASRPRVVWRR
jgi:hypothetical protein